MCARSCKYISQARAAFMSKHIHPQRKRSCHVRELGTLVTTCIKCFRIAGAESQHPISHYHQNAAWLFFFWSTSHLLHYLGYYSIFFFSCPTDTCVHAVCVTLQCPELTPQLTLQYAWLLQPIAQAGLIAKTVSREWGWLYKMWWGGDTYLIEHQAI